MVVHKSFSTKLTIKILTVVSILFILTLLSVYISSGILLSKEASRSANNALQASINDIEESINSIEIITQNYASIAAENITDPNHVKNVTTNMVNNNQYICGCSIAFVISDSSGIGKYSQYSYKDADGNLLQQQPENGYDYWKSDWYLEIISTGQAVWSEPYFGAANKDCLISTYRYPIKGKNGKIKAIITADIPLDWIQNKTDKIHPYEHSFATMLSKNGYFLSTNKDAHDNTFNALEMCEKMGNPKVTEMVKKMLAGETGKVIFSDKGKTYFTVYGPFINGWSMSITSEYKDVLSDMNKMQLILICIGIIGLIIMIVICHHMIRRITQPLTEFSVSAMNMAKGNFNAKLPEIKSEDEMLRMHNSLAYMQKSINTYIRELKTTTSANERMESELNIARNIQLSMLSKNFPQSGPVRIHSLLVPAKEVGGDLYDFNINNDYLYLSIGDVSGKGVPASLVMAIILSAIRFFYGLDFSMKKIIEIINSNVARNNDTGMFCTMFSARINLKTYKMEYCNAGHNPIIIIPADPQEKPYYHKAKSNLALGLIEDFTYEEEYMELAPGTHLILYTDGVTEAENRKKSLYCEGRLLDLISTQEFRKLDPEEMVKAIYADVKNFTNNIEANDDITLLVVEI